MKDDTISRQAAIDALIEWYGCEPSDIGAFENIIEKLPSAQPEPCEDADKLAKCRFEYINACKTIAHRTPDTKKQDIYDAYAVIHALKPIFRDVEL